MSEFIIINGNAINKSAITKVSKNGGYTIVNDGASGVYTVWDPEDELFIEITGSRPTSKNINETMLKVIKTMIEKLHENGYNLTAVDYGPDFADDMKVITIIPGHLKLEPVQNENR